MKAQPSLRSPNGFFAGVVALGVRDEDGECPEDSEFEGSKAASVSKMSGLAFSSMRPELPESCRLEVVLACFTLGSIGAACCCERLNVAMGYLTEDKAIGFGPVLAKVDPCDCDFDLA